MMTIKLDMKHICKKGGMGLQWVGWGVWGEGQGEEGGAGDVREGRRTGRSELFGGGDPDVGPRLFLDDQLDFVVDLL